MGRSYNLKFGPVSMPNKSAKDNPIGITVNSFNPRSDTYQELMQSPRLRLSPKPLEKVNKKVNNNNIRVTPATKLGRKSIAESLEKIVEKNKKSIVDCLEKSGNKRKTQWNTSGSEPESKSPERSPKKSRKDLDVAVHEPIEVVSRINESEEEPVSMGDVDSSGVAALMKKLDDLSSQVQAARYDHSQQISNLETTINSRFESQDRRLSILERDMEDVRCKEKNNDELKDRITALESTSGAGV